MSWNQYKFVPGRRSGGPGGPGNPPNMKEILMTDEGYVMPFPYPPSPGPDPSPIGFLQEMTPMMASAMGFSAPVAQPLEEVLDTGGIYRAGVATLRVAHINASSWSADEELQLVLQTSISRREDEFTDLVTLAGWDNTHSTSTDLQVTWYGLGTTSKVARFLRWQLEVPTGKNEPATWQIRLSVKLQLYPMG